MEAELDHAHSPEIWPSRGNLAPVFPRGPCLLRLHTPPENQGPGVPPSASPRLTAASACFGGARYTADTKALSAGPAASRNPRRRRAGGQGQGLPPVPRLLGCQSDLPLPEGQGQNVPEEPVLLGGPKYHTGFLPAGGRAVRCASLGPPAARGCWFPRWPRRTRGSDTPCAQVTPRVAPPLSAQRNWSVGP